MDRRSVIVLGGSGALALGIALCGVVAVSNESVFSDRAAVAVPGSPVGSDPRAHGRPLAVTVHVDDALLRLEAEPETVGVSDAVEVPRADGYVPSPTEGTAHRRAGAPQTTRLEQPRPVSAPADTRLITGTPKDPESRENRSRTPPVARD